MTFDPKTTESRVPCNGCTACCRDFQAVPLQAAFGEKAEDYLTTTVEGLGAILKHRENGDCIYLGEKGCLIYSRRPVVCRGFDCAGAYKMAGHPARRAQMVAEGTTSAAVFERGKQLIRAGYRPQSLANRRRLSYRLRMRESLEDPK